MEVTINFTKREAKLVEYAAELNKLNVEEYIRKVIMEYVQAELSSDKYNKTFDLEELKQIVAPIADKYGLEAVYLFGSQARGDAKPNSDYDFFVKRGKKQNKISKIREKIIKIENGDTKIFEKYWESNLPPFLQHDIDALLEGKKKQVLYVDCLLDEVYGSINSAYYDGSISKEQADYLRQKYLGIPPNN